jgi:hypothetical protein
MVVTEVGIEIEEMEVEEKDHSPMVFTEVGIEMEVREVQE